MRQLHVKDPRIDNTAFQHSSQKKKNNDSNLSQALFQALLTPDCSAIVSASF